MNLRSHMKNMKTNKKIGSLYDGISTQEDDYKIQGQVFSKKGRMMQARPKVGQPIGLGAKVSAKGQTH